jgi:hypothetical protein
MSSMQRRFEIPCAKPSTPRGSKALPVPLEMVMDSWGSFKTPCPNCDGKVEWFSFGADCRGNEASNGCYCSGCGNKYDVNRFRKLDAARREEEKHDAGCRLVAEAQDMAGQQPVIEAAQVVFTADMYRIAAEICDRLDKLIAQREKRDDD